MPKENRKSEKQTSWWEKIWNGIVSGALAGAAEVTVDHPFWTLKTRYQNDKIPKDQKFTLNPKILYRGFLPNIFSMVPITAIQVGTAEGIRAQRLPETQGRPSEMEAISYNAAGGALSAMIGGPTELIMAQQTKERGFFSTLMHLYRTQGLRGFTRGLMGTAVRDAKFTTGYGFASPYLKKQYSAIMPENQASVAGGISAGIGVALLSQPWDTLKTAQQTGSMLSLWSLTKEKVMKEGVAGLYKGSIWRMGRVASAVMIMGEVQQRVSNWLKPKP